MLTWQSKLTYCQANVAVNNVKPNGEVCRVLACESRNAWRGSHGMVCMANISTRSVA